MRVVHTAADVTRHFVFVVEVSNFEKTFIRENRWQMILSGLLVTLEISVLSGIFGTALGFGLCLLLRSRRRAVSGTAEVFCRIMEGVPNLVVLLIVNFVIFASSDIAPVAVAVISFSVIFAVSVAGTLNTGINAVGGGQWERLPWVSAGRPASSASFCPRPSGMCCRYTRARSLPS